MYLSMAKRIMNRIGNKGKRVNLLVMSCEVIPDAFGEATGCVRFERSSREYPPTIGPTDAEPPPSPRSAASRNVLAVTGSLAAAWSPSSNLCSLELAENRPGFCRGTATRLPARVSNDSSSSVFRLLRLSRPAITSSPAMRTSTGTASMISTACSYIVRAGPGRRNSV